MHGRVASSVVVAVLAAALLALAQDAPLFTSDFPPEEFATRRAKVYDAIGAEGIALVQGAPAPEGYLRFRQANDFYYLCGIEVPRAYLLLDGASRRATLFLPHRNDRRERSEGKGLSAEDAELVTKLAGVEAVAGTDLLGEALARYGQRGATKAVFVPLQPAEGLSVSRDGALRAVGETGSDPFDGRPSREGVLVRNLRDRFPWLEVRNLTPTLDEVRLIKSPREVALIKRATRLACLSILEAMRSTEPGTYEHELDGASRFVYYRHGAQGEAYYSLVASGENAWYPHYASGKRKMKDGEMVLMDHAPDIGYSRGCRPGEAQRYNGAGVAMLLMPWLVALTALACSPTRDGEEAGFARAREDMVATQIAARGVRDPKTLAAMRKVARHLFVPPSAVAQAYEDHPLPIGHGQTISQPYIVGFMTEALGLEGGESVLEVGTGSGYQAAVLAEIAARVHTIEIVTPLAEESAALLKRLAYANVEVRAGDGYLGWPEAAPFDAIMVTAAAPRVPEPLKLQLKDGGRLILPVGDEWQELVVVTRRGDRFEEKRVLPVRFVPMTGKVRQ